MTINNWCDLLNLVSSLMEPFFSIVFVSAFMGERFDKRRKKIAGLTVMIEAIYKAHDINQTIIAFIDKIVAEVGKEKHSYVSCAVPGAYI